ncbi:MAG: hypothetical protein IPO63_13615 [Bacteroidetes bacterium]|nr:hypothetical protein [Bacteroidota bacterium]
MSIILFFLLSFHSCKKDEGGASVPNPFFYLNDLVADDITYTDSNGNIIFTIDSTDWTTLDIFSHSIGALFSFNDTINYNNVDTSTVTVYPAFPNPNSNPFNETLSIYYNSSQVTVLKFVVVDSAQNVVIRYAKKINPGVDKVQFLFNDPNAPPNSKYRILYRFYSAHNKYYKSGHGDILIN